MKSGDLLFWIWLSETLGAGSSGFRKLIELYDSPYDIFHADTLEIERISGISERVRHALSDKNLTHASSVLDACERSGIGILSFDDENYPRALREIQSPPAVLYYRGKLPDWNHRLSIGMVGTRRMSAYGLHSAYKIAYELATARAIVVSGMAAGIDGVCAAAALKAGGDTVAVLGCGVDVVYPGHHKVLAENIAKDGLLLSEYAPGTRPNSYHFPVRNRIISGLSQATVVVEAGIRSGSLITAKNAILQGRDVFALPANVGRNGAEGTNGLLHDGAKLALDTSDILKPYEYIYAKTLRTESLSSVGESGTPDLAYLSRIGVIEWDPNADTSHALPKEHDRSKRSGKPKTAKNERTVSAPAEPAADCENAATADAHRTPDEVLSSLSSVQLALLQAIPDDCAVSADQLCNLGHPQGETIAALTMLEIMGLIQKLPGALYKKA